MKLALLPRRCAVVMIRGYQLTLSPYVGGQCRFHPTCSRYAMEAIEQHGLARGILLALGRLARCHPFNAGGFDPVPARGRWRVDAAAVETCEKEP